MDHQVKITKWLGKNSPDQTPITGVALLDASGQAVGLSQLTAPLSINLGDKVEVRVATDQPVAEQTEDEKKTFAKLKLQNERMKEDVTRQEVQREQHIDTHKDVDDETAHRLKEHEEARKKAVVETAGAAKSTSQSGQGGAPDSHQTSGTKSLTSVAATGKAGEVDPNFNASTHDHRQ